MLTCSGETGWRIPVPYPLRARAPSFGAAFVCAMIPAMRDHDPDEYLQVEADGNVAGISPRTLRYWVRGGKLPAIEGQRGKLVRLADVLALAELTGKTAMPATRQSLPLAMPAMLPPP